MPDLGSAWEETHRSSLRVDADALKQFSARIFEAAGCSEQHAATMGEVLVGQDMVGGRMSHGTACIGGRSYCRHIAAGLVNPRPQISVISSTPTTRVYDGDGGMGHLVCHEATAWAIETAKKFGTAAFTTRNHFHFGGAGMWTRQAAEAGLMGLSMSSHRYPLKPGASIETVHGGSPMSFGLPAGDEPDLILDMATHLTTGLDTEEMFDELPASFLKDLALGAVLRGLAGHVAGIYRPEVIHPDANEDGYTDNPTGQWENSNQGSFVTLWCGPTRRLAHRSP